MAHRWDCDWDDDYTRKTANRITERVDVAARTGYRGTEQPLSYTGISSPSYSGAEVGVRGLRLPVKMAQRLHPMFHTAATWATRTGNSLRVVSGNDHDHVDDSLHYEDRALDFHSSDLDGLATHLRNFQYRVLWQVAGHYFHVHAEG